MIGQYIYNRRVLSVLFLGFSSGIPLALTSSTLQAWFTQAGLNLMTIGFLSFIGLPYVWKFIWSPIFDRYNPFSSRRKGWIVLTQVGLTVVLLGLAQLNPEQNLLTMMFLAFVIAFISASQDIAIDAYRTDVLVPAERGLGAAAFIFAYRVAMLISGGLALVLADQFGWRMTYEFMALLMFLSIFATLFAPGVPNAAQPKTFAAAVIEPFLDLWQQDKIVLIFLFILFYKIGDALALSLMSNFLLRYLHFSLTDIGVVFKTFGLSATILGAFVGGLLLVRLTLFNALLWFGLLQAFSNLFFVLLALFGKNYILMVSAIFIENFCSGMSTSAFLVFLMSLCNHQYTATQFAVLSAIMAFGRVFAGPIASMLVEWVGWTRFFGWAFLLSFPGLFFLTALRSRVGSQNAEVTI